MCATRSTLALVAAVAMAASASTSATECDQTAVFDVANAHYPSCEGLYYVLAQSMPVKYTSRLCSTGDCQAAFAELRALNLTDDCTMFGNTTLVEDILDQCPTAGSAETTDESLCDISSLFSIADAHYPSCEGLYYVLAESMPISSTAELCDVDDCARAFAQLRDLNAGDCVVFGTTKLESDILSQCPTSSSRKLSAAAGTAIVLGVLAFVIAIIAATVVARRARLAKQSLERLEEADGKLAGVSGGSDAMYSAAVDLQAAATGIGLRGIGQN